MKEATDWLICRANQLTGFYVREPLTVKGFKIMKMLNASIFSFIILILVKKSILDFHVTTATDIGMKEVIDSCLLGAL